MKKKIVSVMMTAVLSAAVLAGCGGSTSAASSAAPASEAEAPASAASSTAAASEASQESTESTGDKVVLKCVADLTPHSEILEAAKDQLAEAGIEVDVVSTTWDATWNDMLVDGEVDFAYFMHVPAMESIEEEMGTTLYSMGGVHVEPYTCFSNKYGSVDELPENAVIAVPNDSSNEYRALKVLEKEGFITLKADTTAINSTVQQVEEYKKPIEIVEMDQANIIPAADDFDAYFVNANRALEANIDTTKFLMREGEDSEYANIITVTEANKDNESIKKLVEILQSDEIKQFITDKYNGAVIPAAN